jgi:hypothetical protein
MVDERERFPLLWQTLDRPREREVWRTAYLGRRASDPETAWFVKVFAGERSRPIMVIGPLVGIFVGLGIAWNAWMLNNSLYFATAILLILVWLLFAVVTLMCRRAFRANEPIAVPPGCAGHTRKSGAGTALPLAGVYRGVDRIRPGGSERRRLSVRAED